MPIYFPHGFNSGEPVRVLDGVTFVLGKLSKQKADLVVMSGSRGVFGGPEGATVRESRAVFRAAASGIERRFRALPSHSNTLHLLPPGKLPCRHLGYLECDRSPSSLAEIRRALSIVEEGTVRCGATEVALGPFRTDMPGVLRFVKELMNRQRRSRTELRWIVVLSSRFSFQLAIGAPSSPDATD